MSFRFAVGIALLLGMFALPAVAHAATLSFSPASGSHNTGQTFTVTVTANSTQQMNAVEATVRFNPSLLSVTNVSKDGSVFSLWTTEPTFSNTAGTVRFGGGTPAGFTGNSTIVRITFRATGAGTAQLTFDDASVLAADGMGTNILSGTNPASFELGAAPAPTPTPTPAATPAPTPTPATGTLPPRPAIESSTHEDEESWYSSSTAHFSWTVPSGVNGVRLLISRSENATPTVVHSPPVSSREIEGLDDGVWYFFAQFRNAAGWGPVARRTVRVDTVPPEQFSVEVVSDDPGTASPTLAFESSDELSGIRHYEIQVGGQDPVLAAPEGMENGTYQLSGLPRGVHRIVVIAVDNAGNTTEAEAVEVEVEEDVLPARPAAPVEEEEEQPPFWREHRGALFSIFLMFIIVVLAGLMVMQKKRFKEEFEIAERETKEIRTVVEKVFSALREEAGDLIAAFDNKPGYSPKEKKAAEKLGEAIDISEEMITKEVEDVEKLLKQ